MAAELGAANFSPTPEQAVGFRGDGSGSFPGATPPPTPDDGTRWQYAQEPDPRNPQKTRKVIRWSRDTDRQRNIRWRTMMPNWSNASPIVVGNKAFVMAEPVDYAPLLICVDTVTGSIQWQRSVDHLDAVPMDSAEDVEQAKQDWSACWALARKGAHLFAQRQQAIHDRKTKPDDPKAQTALSQWENNAHAANFVIPDKEKKPGHWGVVKLNPGFLTPQVSDTLNRLRKYNCYFRVWELGVSKQRLQVGAYVGMGQPSPASDGERVYVYTGYHHAAAYNLQGEQIWQRWLGPYERVPGERLAKWMDFTQSPVLVDGRLLVAAKRELVCLDAASGEILWRHQTRLEDMKLGQGYDCLLFTGRVVRVAGEAYFFWYDGRVYRVADGKMVSDRLLGHDGLYISVCPMVAGDTIICFATGKKERSVRAIRLLPGQNGMLKPEIRWRHPLPTNPHNGVIANGKVYIPCKSGRPQPGPIKNKKAMAPIIDLASGEITASALFNGDHLGGLMHVGNQLITLSSVRSGQGLIRRYDLSGKQIDESYLSSAPLTAERRQLIAGWRGSYGGWQDGYYHGAFHAAPYFHGKNMYVRSRDELICIGPDDTNKDAE